MRFVFKKKFVFLVRIRLLFLYKCQKLFNIIKKNYFIKICSNTKFKIPLHNWQISKICKSAKVAKIYRPRPNFCRWTRKLVQKTNSYFILILYINMNLTKDSIFTESGISAREMKRAHITLKIKFLIKKLFNPVLYLLDLRVRVRVRVLNSFFFILFYF